MSTLNFLHSVSDAESGCGIQAENENELHTKFNFAHSKRLLNSQKSNQSMIKFSFLSHLAQVVVTI